MMTMNLSHFLIVFDVQFQVFVSLKSFHHEYVLTYFTMMMCSKLLPYLQLPVTSNQFFPYHHSFDIQHLLLLRKIAQRKSLMLRLIFFQSTDFQFQNIFFCKNYTIMIETMF